MKTEPLNNLFTWLVCTLAALAIAVSSMDGPTELEAAQAVADAVGELEYAAIADEGGAAFCAQFRRVPHLRPDGDLICRAAAPVVAQGEAP